jgi:hypothetical protein
MSAQTLRLLIAGALFVHAVGHSLGFWMPSSSWILPNVSESTLKIVSRILWILSIVGFLASFLGFLGFIIPVTWWRSLAIVFAFVSLLGLFLFWNTWPTFNLLGAVSMNIVVLVTQLVLHWPAENTFGG